MQRQSAAAYPGFRLPSAQKYRTIGKGCHPRPEKRSGARTSRGGLPPAPSVAYREGARGRKHDLPVPGSGKDPMTSDLGEFIAPEYADRCFTGIPRLITHLLAGEEAPALPGEVFRDLTPAPRSVVLILLDAFGWRAFTRHGDHPFLQAVARRGRVVPLTSQFPSTTSAHLTCAHTGLPVGQSGVLEWNYYEPGLDEMITPLLFSFAGDPRIGG